MKSQPQRLISRGGEIAKHQVCGLTTAPMAFSPPTKNDRNTAVAIPRQFSAQLYPQGKVPVARICMLIVYIVSIDVERFHKPHNHRSDDLVKSEL